MRRCLLVVAMLVGSSGAPLNPHLPPSHQSTRSAGKRASSPVWISSGSSGIPGDTDKSLAALGNNICRGLRNGLNIGQVIPFSDSRGYGDARSGQLSAAAVGSICPEQADNLLRGGG